MPFWSTIETCRSHTNKEMDRMHNLTSKQRLWTLNVWESLGGKRWKISALRRFSPRHSVDNWMTDVWQTTMATHQLAYLWNICESSSAPCQNKAPLGLEVHRFHSLHLKTHPILYCIHTVYIRVYARIRDSNLSQLDLDLRAQMKNFQRCDMFTGDVFQSSNKA